MPNSWYDIGEQRIQVERFSTEQLSELIQLLDNDKRTCVKINHPTSTLIVFGGNQDRVKVIYMDDKYHQEHQHGTLIDPDIPLDAGEIMIAINFDRDHEPLRETISKQTAIDVATYYLEHGAPPKGLVWTGNMSDFT